MPNETPEQTTHAERLARAVREQEETRAMSDDDLLQAWNSLSARRNEAEVALNRLNRETDAFYAEIIRRGFKPNTTDQQTPIEYLRSIGRRVDFQDIPGLYRVDDGPEITFGQLMQLAQEERARNVGR